MCTYVLHHIMKKCKMTNLESLLYIYNNYPTMKSSDTPFPIKDFVFSVLLEFERII